MDIIQVDPFAFWPTLSSQIIGLGGPEPGPDPTYALHTNYVACGEGTHRFRLRFEGFAASDGELEVKVLSHLVRMPGVARQEAREMFQARRIARSDGGLTIDFEATHHREYAIIAHLHASADARAHGLTVFVEPAEAAAAHPAGGDDDASGAPRTRRVATLASNAPITLLHPTSQPYTDAQTAEPVFAAWLERAGVAGRDGTAPWETAYILQALHEYGSLRTGARGLALLAPDDPVVRVLIDAGCGLTVVLAAPDAGADAAAAAGARLDAMRLLHGDPLIDPLFYGDTGDLAAEAHYAGIGWREGRDPNPWFSSAFYRAQSPDVPADIDPLLHWRVHGWRAGRDPSPHFDVAGYLAAHPDVAGSGLDPLTHFLLFGPPDETGRDAATNRVDILEAATPDAIPAGLTGFDFVVSRDRIGHLAVADVPAFLVASLEALAPGGTGVHILPYAGEDAGDEGEPFDANALRRFALAVLGTGDSVAQIKTASETAAPRRRGGAGRDQASAPIPFGMILRRE